MLRQQIVKFERNTHASYQNSPGYISFTPTVGTDADAAPISIVPGCKYFLVYNEQGKTLEMEVRNPHLLLKHHKDQPDDTDPSLTFS